MVTKESESDSIFILNLQGASCKLREGARSISFGSALFFALRSFARFRGRAAMLGIVLVTVATLTTLATV